MALNGKLRNKMKTSLRQIIVNEQKKNFLNKTEDEIHFFPLISIHFPVYACTNRDLIVSMPMIKFYTEQSTHRQIQRND